MHGIITLPEDKYYQIVKELWEQLYPHATGASLLYHPDAWMPHITVAHADVTPKNLDCVMQKLAFRSFDWELNVDCLAYISQPKGEIGKLQYRVSFEKQAILDHPSELYGSIQR